MKINEPEQINSMEEDVDFEQTNIDDLCGDLESLY